MTKSDDEDESADDEIISDVLEEDEGTAEPVWDISEVEDEDTDEDSINVELENDDDDDTGSGLEVIELEDDDSECVELGSVPGVLVGETDKEETDVIGWSGERDKLELLEATGNEDERVGKVIEWLEDGNKDEGVGELGTSCPNVDEEATEVLEGDDDDGVTTGILIEEDDGCSKDVLVPSVETTRLDVKEGETDGMVDLELNIWMGVDARETEGDEEGFVAGIFNVEDGVSVLGILDEGVEDLEEDNVRVELDRGGEEGDLEGREGADNGRVKEPEDKVEDENVEDEDSGRGELKGEEEDSDGSETISTVEGTVVGVVEDATSSLAEEALDIIRDVDPVTVIKTVEDLNYCVI